MWYVTWNITPIWKHGKCRINCHMTIHILVADVISVTWTAMLIYRRLVIQVVISLTILLKYLLWLYLCICSYKYIPQSNPHSWVVRWISSSFNILNIGCVACYHLTSYFIWKEIKEALLWSKMMDHKWFGCSLYIYVLVLDSDNKNKEALAMASISWKKMAEL